jgi:nickel transport protein
MRFVKPLLVLMVLGLVLAAGPGASYAHGVGYRRSEKSAVALEFYYSTGETMAYQEARIYSPNDDKASFQSGRTDEFGRVAFVPDISGDWRVVVHDEEGHRAEAVVAITREFLEDAASGSSPAAAESSIPRGFELFLRAMLGVSILFNVAAVANAHQ